MELSPWRAQYICGGASFRGASQGKFPSVFDENEAPTDGSRPIKANSAYGLLTKLLRLPPAGNLSELYVEALVHQARQAREVLDSFRVVLLAQDCPSSSR